MHLTSFLDCPTTTVDFPTSIFSLSHYYSWHFLLPSSDCPTTTANAPILPSSDCPHNYSWHSYFHLPFSCLSHYYSWLSYFHLLTVPLLQLTLLSTSIFWLSHYDSWCSQYVPFQTASLLQLTFLLPSSACPTTTADFPTSIFWLSKYYSWLSYLLPSSDSPTTIIDSLIHFHLQTVPLWQLMLLYFLLLTVPLLQVTFLLHLLTVPILQLTLPSSFIFSLSHYYSWHSYLHLQPVPLLQLTLLSTSIFWLPH